MSKINQSDNQSLFGELAPEKITKKKKEKIVKLTAIQKKCEIIKSKMGKMVGSFGIIETASHRYNFILRYVVKGSKKEKIKLLFSSPNLKLIQDIGIALVAELSYPYNPEPQEKSKKEKIETYPGFEIDHSIFKYYDGQCIIYLPFGSIILEQNKFHTKRNHEKINGTKILELYGNNRMSAGFSKCLELIKTFDTYILNEFMKEIMHFGDTESKNSVRLALGLKPLVSSCNNDGTGVMFREYGGVVICN